MLQLTFFNEDMLNILVFFYTFALLKKRRINNEDYIR